MRHRPDPTGGAGAASARSERGARDERAQPASTPPWRRTPARPAPQGRGAQRRVISPQDAGQRLTPYWVARVLGYLGREPERAASRIPSYKVRIWRVASATSSSL